MCDLCGNFSSEVHECAMCGSVFCLDCGYLRYNETAESDWICCVCDETNQAPSFAQGKCPNCGHDWTAHSAYIANGQKICVEVQS